MYCTKCGNKAEDGMRFCTKCGNKLNIPEEKPAEVKPETEEKTVEVNPETKETTAENTTVENLEIKDTAVENTAEIKIEKTSGKGIKIAIITVLIIIILGLLGTIGYLLFNKNSEESNESSKKYEDDFDDDEDEIEDKKDNDDEDIADEDEEDEEFAEDQEEINIEIRQVDNTAFPEVVLYTSIIDTNGEVVENLTDEDFNVVEIDKDGYIVDTTLEDMYQVLDEDKISIELVMDASGSMDYDNKMQHAKNAAFSLVEHMNLEKGDQVGVISFDDFVYLQQSFTSQSNQLTEAIDNIYTGDNTALFDGIYAGLYQTNLQSGAKCVIAFTDGEENASSYSFNDVVYMAQNTGIPVFIIGIGSSDDIDEYQLEDLAEQCSGKYYLANDSDLETILEDIYLSIYKEQQNCYVIKYKTTNTDDRNEFRDVELGTTSDSKYYGIVRKSYIPETDISGAFSDDYSDVDFILPYSSDRALSYSDLDGLSLAELRIARNEMFARHGRQFNDPFLNQWFYSKTWYLNIPQKYSPQDFDKWNPDPLSKLELENAELIRTYENEKMKYEDIFPDASKKLLSEYDLALSKIVLKNALEQMKHYHSNDILEENMNRVREEIDKEDIQY